MNRKIPAVMLICLIFFLLMMATSCSNLLGYGVLLWSLPDQELYSGDIVPVYIKSNISHVYVIGTGDSKEDKMEIPLWQIELFKSKKAAREYSAQLGEYTHIYAETVKDGLPMRSVPENLSDRVYRLREGQRIKILKKGEGAPVMSGSTALEGDWLYALTDDGVKGWVFSYNLRLYDENDEGAVNLNTTVDTEDTVLTEVLSKNWYPDSYREMLSSKRVNLQEINPGYGFFPGKQAGVVRISVDGFSLSVPFSGISKEGDKVYRFDGTSVKMTVRSSDTLLVQCTDKDGVPLNLFFVALDITPEEIIQQENDRRDTLFSKILALSSSYYSSNYGQLQFLSGGHFLWSGYQLLSPSVIPSGSGISGLVSFEYFLGNSLKDSYDGVISFNFESSQKKVSFLYRLEENGIRLEEIPESNIRNNVVQNRKISPLILFFTAQENSSGDSDSGFMYQLGVY